MIPASFEYTAPESLDDALALLQEHGEDAKVLTGGHSLIPLMKLRLARPSVVIDLRRIEGLAGIREKELEGGGLEIGAATTHAEVQRSPLVRNAGTIGGSVVHADPAADWPAALLASGATVVLAGLQGERLVRAEDFFVGLLQSAIRPGEILVAIRFPARAQRSGGAYRKLAQSASGFAIAGAAVELVLADARIASARIGITGVAERAYRPERSERALEGCALHEDSIREACGFAAEGVEPLADIHAGARYRAHVACVLARRAVLAAIERAEGER